jgi:hypothetical protein
MYVSPSVYISCISYLREDASRHAYNTLRVSDNTLSVSYNTLRVSYKTLCVSQIPDACNVYI